MRTLFILFDKEFRQFMRNAFLPKMIFTFPLMTMLIIPLVTTMDVKHISIDVIDGDHSIASQRLTQKINASDYFSLREISEHYETSLSALEDGKIDVIVEIPNEFEESLLSGKPKKVSVYANGVNAMKGSLGSQYTVQTIAQTLSELQREQGFSADTSSLIAIENRYNPTLEYRFYMIPGLMIMLLIMICGFMPALNLVSEKEIGTIEQINVTPLSRFTFTLAKLLLYWILGFTVLSLVMVIAGLVYGLWPQGSLGAIYLAAGLFILTMSGLGIMVANKSATMQQAMFVMYFIVLIFVLLSGLITPIESMPDWAQKFTYALPPRYFIEIMRSVYLKGTHICDLWLNYGALAVSAVIFNTFAAVTYRKQS